MKVNFGRSNTMLLLQVLIHMDHIELNEITNYAGVAAQSNVVFCDCQYFFGMYCGTIMTIFPEICLLAFVAFELWFIGVPH